LRPLLVAALLVAAPALAQERLVAPSAPDSARDTALTVLKHLAEGDIERAAALSNAPPQRLEAQFGPGVDQQAHTIVTLDISDPAHPVEVARRPAEERDVPGLVAQEPQGALEGGGLPGAIEPDETVYGAARHRQVDPGEHLAPAEALPQSADMEWNVVQAIPPSAPGGKVPTWNGNYQDFSLRAVNR